jgi:hypothetical protein
MKLEPAEYKERVIITWLCFHPVSIVSVGLYLVRYTAYLQTAYLWTCNILL